METFVKLINGLLNVNYGSKEIEKNEKLSYLILCSQGYEGFPGS